MTLNELSPAGTMAPRRPSMNFGLSPSSTRLDLLVHPLDLETRCNGALASRVLRVCSARPDLGSCGIPPVLAQPQPRGAPGQLSAGLGLVFLCEGHIEPNRARVFVS
jgi:hypothetical protein